MLVPLPILAWKAGLSPQGAPSRGHDFETVTPDVRAPLDSWSFWFHIPAKTLNRWRLAFSPSRVQPVLMPAQISASGSSSRNVGMRMIASVSAMTAGPGANSPVARAHTQAFGASCDSTM
jgi:hypothetical protein